MPKTWKSSFLCGVPGRSGPIA
jgi:transcription antitermination factor NusG